MKKTQTITIDVEVWSKSKIYTDNLSGTINDLLTAWIQTKDKELDSHPTNKLKKLVAEQEAELIALRSELNKKVSGDEVVMRFE